MTNSNKQTQPGSNHLFENDFAYVTSDGELRLKKNSLFKERTIATIDPEALDEKIQEFEESFTAVQTNVEHFLTSAEDSVKEDIAAAQKKFDELLSEIGESAAIGDFETLVGQAREKFESLKEQVAGEGKPDQEEEPSVEENVTAGAAEEIQEEEETPAGETTEALETETDPKADEDAAAEEKESAEAEGTAETEESSEPDSSEEKSLNEKPLDTEEESGSAEDRSEPEEEDEEVSAEEYYKKLAEKAEELPPLTDWAYVSVEFDSIDNLWSEGPETDSETVRGYRTKIDELRRQFEEKKKAHYEEQKKIRLENLEKKKELLKRLKDIIDEKKWTLTKEVARIKGRWEHIKPIPAEEAEKLQQSFDGFLATFDEHKVDRLVKRKQQEEDNLTGKLVILEKMGTFVSGLEDTADWAESDKTISDLVRQFRKIGRIPAEKNQEVWDKFHQIEDEFHSRRFKLDKKYRAQIEKFVAQKKKLIDEAEALTDTDDLADAARRVNKLHRKWKKTGNLPQKDENEMWERFKAATDAFNQKKSENIDQLREQEDQNYESKLELIKKADELKDSEEWEETHKEYQKIMNLWKQIGPVPKRKSGKIWKKLKTAMDHFYERRREFFKEVKEERKDNLKEKEEVLKKLAELKSHADPIEAVELAKPLQEEFKKAGYVPIKHKNRLWKEYRETCDVIYERFRAGRSAAEVVGRKNLENFSTDDLTDIRNMQKEADKLRKQATKLDSELLQMQESMSYFKPSGSGSSLLDDVREKIEKAETDLAGKREKIEKLETDIEKLKKQKTE